MNEKIKTARLSIFSNTSLIIIKMIVGIISGSVSLISEAIHSGIDLLASIVAFYAVKISSKPPDENHPYGHGKFENVSGVIEAILIFVAAIWIILKAIDRLMDQKEIHYVQYGILVMLISVVINYFVAKKLYRVAKETDSIALEADALHLRTDIYTSLGVALGFVLIYITGFLWLDSIIAILVALMIIYKSIILLNNAFSPLVDKQLPQDDIKTIKEIIKNKLKNYRDIKFERLRTRKSGSQKYLDFILYVPNNMSVKKAHDLCDEIENHVQQNFKFMDINIHIEPNSTLKEKD